MTSPFVKRFESVRWFVGLLNEARSNVAASFPREENFCFSLREPQKPILKPFHGWVFYSLTDQKD